MGFIPIKGYKDQPENGILESAHLGVSFDYIFMGKRQGEGSMLLLQTLVYDHTGRRFSRKGEYIPRYSEVKKCIEVKIREHLLDLGVDKVQVNGLLRDFEVDNSKFRPFDRNQFLR